MWAARLCLFFASLVGERMTFEIGRFNLESKCRTRCIVQLSEPSSNFKLNVLLTLLCLA